MERSQRATGADVRTLTNSLYISRLVACRLLVDERNRKRLCLSIVDELQSQAFTFASKRNLARFELARPFYTKLSNCFERARPRETEAKLAKRAKLASPRWLARAEPPAFELASAKLVSSPVAKRVIASNVLLAGL